MAASSRRVFIIVRAPNGDVREVPIGQVAVVIGRDESADIRVEDKKVSRRHAAFKLIDREPWVEDLGSANGVKLNGKRIEKRAKFTAEDKVRVGGYQITLRSSPEGAGRAEEEIGSDFGGGLRSSLKRSGDYGGAASKVKRVARPPDDGRSPVLEALDPPVSGRRFVLHMGENIIGRLEECDVPVLDGSVSRQHARVTYSREQISVTDLGSSNGTFVNDARVEMSELFQGDVLRTGNVRFRVALPVDLASVASATGARSRRTRVVKSGSSPFWGVAGIVISLLAVALLASTAYWRMRVKERRQAQAATTLAALPPPLQPASTSSSGVSPAASGLRPVEPRGSTSSVATAPSRSDVESVMLWMRDPRAGEKGADGLPMDLPVVDETFDLERFVEERLQLASSAETKGDLGRLRAGAVEILARDPINKRAKDLLMRAKLYEVGEETWARAEKLFAEGKLLKAVKLYVSLPEGAPQAEKARAKAKELQARAIEQELALAERDAENRNTWLRAHRRLTDVLDLEPTSPRALSALRAVERKMNDKNVRFEVYRGPGAVEEKLPDTPQSIDDALSKHYPGDEDLARIARLYVQGALPKAMKRAESVEKRAEGARRERAKGIRQSLKTIQGLYERARNEISNDPHQAWAKLLDIGRAEANILPSEVKSSLLRELEQGVAEAFADRGASLFDRGQYEDAFQRWDAGYKLDSQNAKVLAGLKKLEERAIKNVEETELAAQRGERNLCDRWRAITRMTRADSEVHKRALERAKQGCP